MFCLILNSYSSYSFPESRLIRINCNVITLTKGWLKDKITARSEYYIQLRQPNSEKLKLNSLPESGRYQEWLASTLKIIVKKLIHLSLSL